MDEDDSQDELINRNVSHGKGKRPAMSIVSDDDDNSEGEGASEEAETDSEEDAYEDEEGLDGEEEEDGEEDDSEDEDSGKVLEGAEGNVPTNTVYLSSDEESEKCPICLNSFHEQPVATPQACDHYFCLDCILEWSKSANSCPVDRKVFNNILLRKCYGGKVQKTIAVQKPEKPEKEEQVDVDLDQTCCEVCGGRDREDRLLLCDGCDAGYHMECLTPPLDAVPVEEWFCPECIANIRSSGSDQVSEEDSSSLPTTSRTQSRPTRAIARTQHSERVRANVNRHRITQARTAAQLAPRYLMQSTWLDETINAVVAGLNSAVYVRDLTPRAKSYRRRRTAKRRKTKGKSSAAAGGKTNLGVRRRKRKVRRSKSRRKFVVKKGTNSRGRIAKSLGIKKPKTGSNIPSVYRPSESSLGSMRAEIGAASLSVYGDPFDLDPFDDREDEVQVPTPSSVLDAKRRGLSRSALRSHQPVARPITAGLSRHGGSIPQAGEVAAEPDLLGSILSGQSMLLMDSSDVVINRDGSLKASKPVSLSLQRSTTPRGSSSGEAENSEASPFQSIGTAVPSSSPSRRTPSAHSSPGSCCTPQIPTSPCPPIPSPHLPYSHPPPMGHPRLHPGLPSRPVALNPQRPGNGIRGQPLSRESNGVSDPQHQDKSSTSRQPPVKKPPLKPVWVDVSVLPRIPKIKKEGASNTNNSRGSSSSSLPESSAISLAGNKGREHTVDQQGTNNSHSNRTMDSQTQRSDRTGASSSFSSSFTSTTSSIDASSNSRPSSSSVSFRISSSGNPWHARRLSESGGTLPGHKETVKRNDKSKLMLLSLSSKAEEVKSDTYDPFNPTGSDSSDNESESERPNASTQNTESRVLVEPNEDDCRPIKSEPMDVDSESESEMCPLVKTETDSFSDKPWKWSPCQSDTVQNQTSSKGPVVDCSSSDARLDGGTQESLLEMMSDVKNVKVEVKSEPEAGPSPVRPQSKSLDEEFLLDLQQSSKGNGLCKELPGVSDPTYVPKEEKRSHKSKSKDRRRSPSNSPSPSKDAHKKKRSKDKKRSRSKSRDRLHSKSKDSRSRSKERKCRGSRDRRYSSSSSSRERKTSRKRASQERSDSRGRERQRERHSRSRSFSRSRRRVSKDHADRSKRHKSRSRSTSIERKTRSESHRHKEKISSKTLSAELNEPVANKTSTSLKREKVSRTLESKSSFLSVKQEVSTPTHGLGSSGHNDQTRTLTENKKDVLIELKMLKPEEIKQEKLTHGEIKKEEELYACNEFDSEFELDTVKKEMVSSSDIFSEESPEPSETKLDLGTSQACNPDDKMKETVVGSKTIKTEQIWPDEDDSPCCSDNNLVISLDTPDVENCKKETESNQSPLMDEMELTPAQPADPIKQEDLNSSDEDISVDYLIDNLDFIKKEMSESSVADSTDAVHPKSGAEDAHSDNKTGTESAAGSVKSKSQGKRVTWNLQEPEGHQSDKLSKLALFKLKLKQDASRRSSAVQQTSSQDKAQAEATLTADVSSPLSQDESSRRKSHKEEVLQDPHQKEKYMMKLHMQERAIEEVKLAIKPFYQNRDITKDEYKEILRKAVQKVCHSKSGEINPVKVANLVKAYVDKYKHARKHKKDDSVQSKHADTKDFKTSA